MNPQDAYKWIEMGPKHNCVLKKKNHWSSYPYMYVGLLCNVNPSSTFPPWNAHHILTEVSTCFECVDLGLNRFGELEQHGWTPVLHSTDILNYRPNRPRGQFSEELY